MFLQVWMALIVQESCILNDEANMVIGNGRLGNGEEAVQAEKGGGPRASEAVS